MSTLITIYKTTKAAVAAMPMQRDEQMRGPQAAATVAVRAELVKSGQDAVTATKNAADLCWRIETGKPMPVWVDEMGNQTAASRAYDRACEASRNI